MEPALLGSAFGRKLRLATPIWEADSRREVPVRMLGCAVVDALFAYGLICAGTACTRAASRLHVTGAEWGVSTLLADLTWRRRREWRGLWSPLLLSVLRLLSPCPWPWRAYIMRGFAAATLRAAAAGLRLGLAPACLHYETGGPPAAAGKGASLHASALFLFPALAVGEIRWPNRFAVCDRRCVSSPRK